MEQGLQPPSITTPLRYVSRGLLAQVVQIGGTGVAIKIQNNPRNPHHDTERRIYERLGQHDCITRCFGEISLSTGKKGLLLEFYSAGTLASTFGSGIQDLQTIQAWSTQAIQALNYVHSKGIIHGDIGAHNFLIRHNHSIVLSDFGGSRIDGSSCEVAPSLRYTRPGSSDTDEPREQDDIFALGTVLYEIAMGKALFSDQPDSAIIQLMQDHLFPDTDKIALHDIIDGCWDGSITSADKAVTMLADHRVDASRGREMSSPGTETPALPFPSKQALGVASIFVAFCIVGLRMKGR